MPRLLLLPVMLAVATAAVAQPPRTPVPVPPMRPERTRAPDNPLFSPEREQVVEHACGHAIDRQGRTTMHGNGGNDSLFGGATSSLMFGDEDRDFIAGGPADELVVGGRDADLLIGGLGSDVFRYDAVTDSAADAQGRWSPATGDTIADFRAEDRDLIDLTTLPRIGARAPRAFRWSERQPRAYGVWLAARDADTVLTVDVDGDARGDLAVRMLGEPKLSPAAFCGVQAEG